MSSYEKYIFSALLYTFLAICSQATSALASKQSLSELHENWMTSYGRSYQSEEEKQKRTDIFRDNLKHVNSFNAKGKNAFKLGMNKFADLTNEEFLNKYGTSYRPSFEKPTATAGLSFNYERVQEAPQSLDWRELNAVTPIRNQYACGCCWAFSAVAAIEGIAAISSGVLATLSEQQIMDCSSYHEGCHGGQMVHAFEYVSQEGGLASEADYPYLAIQGECRTKPSSLAAKITGYKSVPSNNETAMLLAVAGQPISVSIDPSLMHLYESGILTGDNCGKNLTHAVTAVGYGESEDGMKFWILKNSWGPDWGEQGYVRVQRDVDDEEGVCGLAMGLSYPIA